jgi:hydrophobic/amphiphilic exporter-1 (mainly G- bacteria), HAE1 family
VNITAFCIKRPITTGMFFLALVVLGIISSSKMPIDLFPQVTFPAINISTSYSGAGPEEIEQQITIPIEQAVSTVNQVKSISSTSQEGSSRVTVDFAWGVNLDVAANDIRSSLDRVKSRLPADAGIPSIFKYDPSSSPVVTLGLSGTMDEASLRQLADNDLSYQLQKVDGVARVDVRGGRNREIRVLLKQERLQTLGITAEQVAAVLKNENAMLPAGHLAVGVGDFLLRTKGEFQSLNEIQNLVIAVRGDIPVYLKDVALVTEGFQTITTLVRIDGQPGIMLSIQKRSGYNTVAVADLVYKVLDQLKEQYPQIKLRIMNDDSIYIRRAVKSVSDAAVIGAILAGLILLFFFYNIRITMIAALAMPISILATLILAYFSKMTLNTISLGGLALGVGMLVDNAVVVLDNILRHHQRDGVDITTAAVGGTIEMGPAISASTITHICVFFPLLYIAGRSGIIFKELSYMVIFSIICSLVVAVTLIPMLCAKFLKPTDLSEEAKSGITAKLSNLQNNWENSYQKLLGWCLEHKLIVVVVCSALFGLTLLIYPLIGTELIQNTDEGVISVNLQLPTGTRLEETDLNTRTLEQSIRKLVPELNHLETTVASSRFGGASSTNQSSLTLRLTPRTERHRSTQQVVEDLQAKLRIPGSRIRVNAPNSMRMLYGGSQFPIDVDVRGYDQALTSQTAVRISDTLSAIPGIANTNMSREEERPELALQINRKRAADFGVTATTIATAVQTNIEGKIATLYRKDGQETQVRVNLQDSDRQSWQDLQRIMVTGSNNRVVPIMSIVDIMQTNGPVSIERIDQERNITVSASLSNRDLTSAMKDIRREVSKISLPPGVNIYYTGDFEEQQQSSKELMAALLLSLVLVYMVMAAQFESFFDPFVIMLSIPFALGGVLLALLLTNTNFNTQVYLGLIMLGGIVVNNAIVLISYIRILIDRGTGLAQAVLIGARSRLRPILMTTVTSILGLLPLALGIGEGSETQTPLARTVIGGLLFSTVLTLILIPVIFTSMEGWLAKNFRRHKPVSGTMLLVVLAGLLLFNLNPVQAEPVQKLTITDAINLALQNNEEGKIIRQKKELAEAVYRENTGAKKVKVYSQAKTVTGEKYSTSLAVTAEKTIPLSNLFGLKSLSDLLAGNTRNIALQNADLQQEQFIYLVVTVFQREISTKRDLQLVEENYQRSRRFYEEITARSKLGFTSISDELGAQSQLVNAEVSLNRSKQLYRLAQLKLRQLLNLDPAAELELVPVQQDQPEFILADLEKNAAANRTDLKQARENVSRGATLLKVAQLSKQLGITLGWNLVRDNFQTGINLSNQDSKTGDSIDWQLGGNASVFPVKESASSSSDPQGSSFSLTLKWTFFDGNVRGERIKEAELLAVQLAEEQKKLEKNIGYDVEEAYYNYLSQKDRLHSSELQVNYNQVYLETAESKLKVGMATVKDVLDAQIILHQSELEYERAQSDLYLAKVSLMKITGQLTVDQIK